MAKKQNQLAKLIQTIEIKNPNGEVVQVPINQIENKLANQILASRLRDVINTQIGKYQEDDIKFTPREIKDLAEAAAKVAEFSGKVYEGDSPLEEKGEKNVTPESGGAVDFSGLNKPAEEKPAE